MTEDGQRAWITGGIILAAYVVVVKPALKLFGQDPESQAKVDSVDNSTPNDNPFSMNYSEGPSGIHMYPDYYIAIEKAYNNGQTDTAYTANDYGLVSVGNDIYSSFNEFLRSLFAEADFNQVLSAFERLGDKASVSWIDAYLQAVKGTSLWSLLKVGLPAWPYFNTNLNNNELAQIVNYVNTLPDHIGQ